MYICRNKECEKFNLQQNPSGRLTVVDGKVKFSGSKCVCGKEMEQTVEEFPNYVVINHSDGRHL